MRVVLAGAAIAAAVLLTGPAFVLAQGAPQTVQLTKVDGKVDDIIIGQDGKTPFLVLSVGGFLGMMGDKLVVLPYEQLWTSGGKIVLPGATKDALKALPEFKYASN